MPNKNTFKIKCINNLLHKYIKIVKTGNENYVSIDPFANKSRIAKITNDLDPEMKCDFSMNALDFVNTFDNNSIDLVFNDPPYSSRQLVEVYKKLYLSVNKETTQSKFFIDINNSIARAIKPNGYAISFGWDTNGIANKSSFEIVEILIVAHGSKHNDTLVTVQKKRNVLHLN